MKSFFEWLSYLMYSRSVHQEKIKNAKLQYDVRQLAAAKKELKEIHIEYVDGVINDKRTIAKLKNALEKIYKESTNTSDVVIAARALSELEKGEKE